MALSMLLVRVMLCSCRLWWERAFVARVVRSLYWKYRCRRVIDAMKKLIVFDLDGTLAESKSSLDAEMATLLSNLLSIVKVAVISGGNWPQFEKQLLSNLSHDEKLKNLSLLPTCGTKFYEYESGWKILYSDDFADGEKGRIISSLHQTIGQSDFKIE